MEFSIFLKGIFVGFSLAVPIGPIGFLCIRQTLTKGRLPGVIIGLGGASADFLFGIIAAFGITIISETLDNQRILIRIIGAAIFLILGIKIFITKNSDKNISPNNTGFLKSYASTVLLTLANPLTVFAYITTFTIIGIGKELTHFSAAVLASGVFMGSLFWFFLLNSIVSIFKEKVSFSWSLRINKITGSLIIISGFVALVSLF